MTAPAYDRLGVGYATGRRAEPTWQAALDQALGDATTVLNVGAGTGSYEPPDRTVLAVEPSRAMVAQRPPGAAPVLRALAEQLPIGDQRFDVAMALVTLHHWSDWRQGLRELLRVARRVVVLHFDPVVHTGFWLVRDYLPELAEVWQGVPSAHDVAELLGAAQVRELPVPWDCVDGFLPAYWRRPAAYLDPQVRRSMSGLQLLPPDVLARGVAALHADLEDGSWHRRHADLRGEPALDVGWRLISTP